MFLNNLIVLVCNFCFSNSAYNKANIFLGLIEYELNSLLSASHLVDYISVHIRFDLERYLLNKAVNCSLIFMYGYNSGAIKNSQSIRHTLCRIEQLCGNAGNTLTGNYPPGQPGAFASKCVSSPRTFAQTENAWGPDL